MPVNGKLSPMGAKPPQKGEACGITLTPLRLGLCAKADLMGTKYWRLTHSSKPNRAIVFCWDRGGGTVFLVSEPPPKKPDYGHHSRLEGDQASAIWKINMKKMNKDDKYAI